jgi:hypothetical protein
MDSGGWNFEVSEVKPNYSYMFDFEAHFTHQKTRIWMQENWTYVFWWVSRIMFVAWNSFSTIIFVQVFRCLHARDFWRPTVHGEQAKVRKTLFQYVYVRRVIRMWRSECEEKRKKIDNLVSVYHIRIHQTRVTQFLPFPKKMLTEKKKCSRVMTVWMDGLMCRMCSIIISVVLFFSSPFAVAECEWFLKYSHNSFVKNLCLWTSKRDP